MDDQVRAILLDIEGTTTPIAFVHEVLFSYARAHARDFLRNNQESDDVRADTALLRQERAADESNNLQPPESIADYIDWLIDRDRKSTGLKSLQGKIWQQGYREGTLKSQVFADIAPALERWHTAGVRISIFSSGSVLAQKLLFTYSVAGDLSRFIDDYFDTNVGKKGEAESYRKIAATLGLQPQEVLFISDVVAELEAAKEAGMKTLLSVRPGNSPQEWPQAIRSFDEV